ncbi:nitric oxide reductase activation protein NorD [Bacillus sp. AFS041924]|uniref:vWA domain-containing protein n=1 Tax=Bacillus sp. AFS041924 TaxID=2033503 RepID=UPI000BFD54EF|nr:VWA domain-containing protein [Bacillus sp. AFS041924]PGS56568.1 VWA domain-containing protein [Bacillus sp. AFS041924]
MKQIVFNNKKIDASTFLQMENLSISLSKDRNSFLEFDFQAYYDDEEQKFTVSHFWDTQEYSTQLQGLKSDVYLKALGNKHYSDFNEFKDTVKELQETHLKSFFTQLYVLLEDIRLEELIIRHRPGTRQIFSTRKNIYRHYFQSQFKANEIRNFQLDQLFCLIYLSLTSTQLTYQTNEQLEDILPILFQTFEAKKTSDISSIIFRVQQRLLSLYKEDMIHTYFGFLPLNKINELTSCNSKVKELKNDDQQDDLDERNSEDERLSTWHRESKNNETDDNFLRFEVESGTKTSIKANFAREEEAGDQAIGNAFGSSQQGENKKSKQTDSYEAANSSSSQQNPYGKYNSNVTIIYKEAIGQTVTEKKQYSTLSSMVSKDVKELRKTIEKSLENKQNSPSDKYYGRLNKKWIRLFTEENPKMFYKKQTESKELDAVFYLLVDCSGSMFNKMDEVKKSVILFHETLKQLKISHSISGFWEDASNATKENKPNILHQVIPYSSSLSPSVGPNIMQLHEEEDNRDGLMIRLVSEALAKRSEKHKFLLVFTDGEPSALDYFQDGIIDTHEAVKQARKLGIEVIGTFIEEGDPQEETSQLMKNIYQHHYLIASNAEDLRLQLKPMLKKLLLRSIE